MAITYEPIATTTLGSATGTVTFSSISGSYTDLILVASGYNAVGDFSGARMRFNSDSGSNYSRTRLYGDGTSGVSSRTANATSAVFIGTGWSTTSSNIGNAIAHIMNYSNTTTYKTILNRANLANSSVYTDVNLWRSTSAITSIELSMASPDTFASGSTFTLYGIKAA